MCTADGSSSTPKPFMVTSGFFAVVSLLNIHGEEMQWKPPTGLSFSNIFPQFLCFLLKPSLCIWGNYVLGLSNYDNTLRSCHTNSSSCSPTAVLFYYRLITLPTILSGSQSRNLLSLVPHVCHPDVKHLQWRIRTGWVAAAGRLAGLLQEENLELPCFCKSDTFRVAFDWSP